MFFFPTVTLVHIYLLNTHSVQILLYFMFLSMGAPPQILPKVLSNPYQVDKHGSAASNFLFSQKAKKK